MEPRELRLATVDDIIKRMQEKPTYERYSVADMGWGMGPAQHGIEDAVREAETLGLVTTERDFHTWKLMASLTDAGKLWNLTAAFDDQPLPQRTPGAALAAAQTADDTAERFLKAQRLDQVHKWLQNQYLSVERDGMGTGYQHVLVETLFFIETGKPKTGNEAEFDEFWEGLHETAQETLIAEHEQNMA